MKMIPAIHEFPNNSNFVIQDLIATFHRVVVVILVRFPGCRDYPFLLDVRVQQVSELHVENHLDLTSFLNASHH